MERPKSSHTKRRKMNEKCTPSLRVTDIREKYRKGHHLHQASTGPFHRRGAGGSAATSQGPFSFCDGRRYTDLGDQRGHFHGGPLHGRRTRCCARARVSGTKCPVFQGFASACRAKEALAPSRWHIGGVRIGKHVCSPGEDALSKLRQTIRLGFDHGLLWDSWNAGVG